MPTLAFWFNLHTDAEAGDRMAGQSADDLVHDAVIHDPSAGCLTRGHPLPSTYTSCFPMGGRRCRGIYHRISCRKGMSSMKNKAMTLPSNPVDRSRHWRWGAVGIYL